MSICGGFWAMATRVSYPGIILFNAVLAYLQEPLWPETELKQRIFSNYRKFSNIRRTES